MQKARYAHYLETVIFHYILFINLFQFTRESRNCIKFIGKCILVAFDNCTCI